MYGVITVQSRAHSDVGAMNGHASFFSARGAAEILQGKCGKKEMRRHGPLTPGPHDPTGLRPQISIFNRPFYLGGNLSYGVQNSSNITSSCILRRTAAAYFSSPRLYGTYRSQVKQTVQDWLKAELSVSSIDGVLSLYCHAPSMRRLNQALNRETISDGMDGPLPFPLEYVPPSSSDGAYPKVGV